MKGIKNSIASKLAMQVILVTIIIFSIVVAWMYYTTKENTEAQVFKEIDMQTALIEKDISETFIIAKQIAKQAALDKDVKQYLKEVNVREDITSHPLYHKMMDTLADYKNTFDRVKYIFISNDRANFGVDTDKEVSKVGYDPKKRPWYKVATEAKGVAFTSPYQGSNTDEIFVSAITALRDNTNKAYGFLSVDISLDTIPEIMKDNLIGKKGKNFLISKQGVVVYAQDKKLVDDKTNIKDIESLSFVGEKVLKGENGIKDVNYQDQDYIVAYVPLKINGWGIIQLIDKKEIYSDLKKFTTYILIAFAIGTILISTIVYLRVRSIMKPISKATKFAELLGEGDFTQEVSKENLKRHDEIGNLSVAFNAMNQNFNKLIGSVIESAHDVSSSSEELTATIEHVATVSKEVATTIDEISKRASEQAENTDSGAKKTYALGEVIESNYQQIESLNGASNTMVNKIDEGLEIVNELTRKTEESNKASQEIFKVVQMTDESTSKIGKASNMIASIAEQTNLLALNAAIEAARAGEAGRGFAVVAEEIRTLAEQSTKSTKEIDDIVRELIDSSSLAVKTISEVKAIINEQVQSVNDTEQKYQEIFAAIQIAVKAIESLNVSSKDMEIKKSEILETIQNLSAIAQENAAASQQASASVEEQTGSMVQIVDASDGLSNLAENLSSLVSKFKIKNKKHNENRI
ncbi:methyl-accepting chemotaxis protein [Clostridiaceae bacterium M8S5]|nr:methyl-accepting chemotaxis protein [Clostridiaceae bacterium M8S5]